MVILCPSCRAKQKVDVNSLVDDGLVRCSECFNVFVVSLENLKELWQRKQGQAGEDARLARFERAAVGDYLPPARRRALREARSLQESPDAILDRTGFDERSQEPDIGAATILGQIVSEPDAVAARKTGAKSWGTLVVMDSGGGQGRAVQLRASPFVIGREGCDLNLRDIEISRRHLELLWRDEPFARDLGSTNGSFLNGKRIGEVQLRHQDQIELGRSRMLFLASEPVRIAPVPAGDLPVSELTLSLSRLRPVKAAAQGDTPVCAGLDVIEGPDMGRHYRFEQASLLIGREAPDIRLSDRQVSRKHCQVELLSRDQIFVKDLASRNGTAVNGVMVKYARLAPGDRITVGDTTLVFLMEG